MTENSILGKIAGAGVGLALYVFLQSARLLLWLLGPRPAPRTGAGKPLRVLITGRVDSKNWCMAHLLPLTQTTNISELLLVVDGKVAVLPKTRQFAVPPWIGWIRPRAIARSAWAIVVAGRERPDVVMAYSLFPPGIFGLLAARWAGAAAVVQLAGGVREIESGGWEGDKVKIPALLARRLTPICQTLCNHFDAVVVRGRKAQAYLREHSHPGQVDIFPGSVNPDRFHVNGQPRPIDIVFIGRIVSIKQPDQICAVIKRVAQKRPHLRAVIAGRGPLLDRMKEEIRSLGLSHVVQFVGHVERVEGLLTRSRVFLLTSRSEGLSIAMSEAMIAGTVPVVADVGDLSELVVNGSTGWLIQPGDLDGYAEKICALLEDAPAWTAMSQNARRLALDNSGLPAVARRWESSLGRIVYST
jgi:glycosyltransferase involved in cell wall biosynthesis